jgi:hypothetical protein
MMRVGIELIITVRICLSIYNLLFLGGGKLSIAVDFIGCALFLLVGN